MKHLACLLMLCALAPSLRAADKIPIFVRAASNAEGFTDPSKARQDSANDLRKKLADSKLLTSAANEADAVAVIEVLDRLTRRESNGWTAFSGARQNKSVLTVRLSAGSYATEFSGESGSKGVTTGYGDAAKKVVQQVEVWVNANRERLSAQR